MYQLYALNQRTRRPYIFNRLIAPPGFRRELARRPTEQQAGLYTNFSARAELYRKLAYRPKAVLVYAAPGASITCYAPLTNDPSGLTILPFCLFYRPLQGIGPD